MKPSTKPGMDPQPPCNYYAAVVEEGNNGTAFDHVLIVTQKDRRNPCIAAMQGWFSSSRVKVQSSSVNEDACMIATAQNLATAAWSTWDTGLSRLNPNLKNLHIPMGEDDYVHYYTNPGWPQHFTKWIVREEGMPYAQHVYTMPRYSTYWHSWKQRRDLMLSYPRDRIVKRSIPALDAGLINVSNATCDWPYASRKTMS
jgi:hypothetical protein